MAQDRINFLVQRLRCDAAIAEVIEAARAVADDIQRRSEIAKIPPTKNDARLCYAMKNLYNRAYIELPDDHG